MAKFVTIGERLSTTAPAVNKAFTERDPEPILKRAKQQLDAGATYLDVNIGPAENDGEDLMKWAVQLLQRTSTMFRLHWILPIRKLSKLVFLYTTEQKENRSLTPLMLRKNREHRPCSSKRCNRYRTLLGDGIAADNDERMMHCQNMLERGMALGMEAEDLWFDPLFLVVKGMQDKQMEVLEASKCSLIWD